MTDLQRSGVDHPQVEPGHARDIGPLESDERREGRADAALPSNAASTFVPLVVPTKEATMTDRIYDEVAA